MSDNASGDEQSEDGELRQSPADTKAKQDLMDFRLVRNLDTFNGVDIVYLCLACLKKKVKI